MTKTLHLVYPNSVFFDQRHYSPEVDAVWFVEEPLFFTQFKYHQQKLVLHRASMKSLMNSFDGRTYELKYFDVGELSDTLDVFDRAKSNNFDHIQIFYPSDYLLEKRINQWADENPAVEVQCLESPLFLNSRSELAEYFATDKDRFRMEDWYRKQRAKRNVLMDGDNPAGGSWNYDDRNRKSLPKNHNLPDNPAAASNTFVTEAIEYVSANFADNPGRAEDFWLPVNHTDAKQWFEDFLTVRFENFGPYEDAIKKSSDSVLYHSVLSPLLNTGLLEVGDVVDRSLEYAGHNNTPINSVEGFIRQLIGWREFMHGLYLHHGVKMRNCNFFGHDRPLPQNFWRKEGIDIDPVDDVIRRALKTGYTHHIERLMIVSNFCVLAEFNPDHVYGWFMEVFIDAYDWVMVPNVYSMALFADGGIMASKPYISSSNYINKMSDYDRDKDNHDHWSAKWDALYWRFMDKHRKFMEQNARMARTTSHLDRMDNLDEKLGLAQAELRRLSMMDPYYTAKNSDKLTGYE